MTEREVVWTDGTWERRDCPTIMDGLVVRYTRHKFSEISASRTRVSINAVNISSPEGLEQVQGIIARAWRQHEHLQSVRRSGDLPEQEQQTA